MLPDLPPTSRSLLRHRRDLPADTVRALDSFGSSDFALPQPDRASWREPEPEPATAAVEAFVSDRGAASDNPRRGESPAIAPANDAGPAPAPRGPFQIADLVARIDAYQRDHGELGRPPRAIASDGPIDH